MQFLYPFFLWALAALAIPVIIHLFHFRRFKKVYFTNVRFLKEIKEETANKNKLKNLLILLTRLLAVAALVLAFAQPFIPKGDNVKTGTNHVSVFVDNSYSMTARKQDIPLVDIAKEKARSVISAYGDDDEFQVLTHDLEGRHQRFVSKEDALTFIDDIDVTPTVQTLDKIINRQNQLFNTVASNRISYLISDYQKTLIANEVFRDSTVEYNLIPIQTAQLKNISIDSVWFDGPIPFINQNNKIVIRVKNNSAEDASQVKISFIKDGQEKPVAVKDIPAHGVITDTVSISVDKPGWHKGVVNILDYPVQFDDNYYLSFQVPDTIRTLVVNEGTSSKYIDAVIKGMKNFSLVNQNVTQLQYQQFPNYDLIILNDLKTVTSGLATELSQYINNGGKLLMFPNADSDVSVYNSFLSMIQSVRLGSYNKTGREVSRINTEEFVFSEVFSKQTGNLKLPKTQANYTVLSSAGSSHETLMTYRDGSPYMVKQRYGDGQAFICLAPLDSEINDLVFNAEIFVPMVFKMAVSTTKQKNISYTITNDIVIETDNKRRTGDYIYKVKNEKSEFIPGQMPTGSKMILSLDNQVKEAGFYDLNLDNDPVGVLAFNYNRLESDMDIYSESELKKMFETRSGIRVLGETLQADMSSTISEKNRGVVLWKWFIIAAIIFLGLEALIIRFYHP